MLHNLTNWLVDGTFKIASDFFSQVYIILAKYLGGILPLIYALLQNKTNKTCERLFKMFLDLKPMVKTKIHALRF